MALYLYAGKFASVDEKPLNPVFVPSIVDNAFAERESMNIDGMTIRLTL